MPEILHVSAPAAGPAAPPPLSLYVHIPWCVRKCPYCDFNSHEARAAVPEARYCEALQADLEAALPRVWGRRIHSVFLGGGTPSLFSVAAVDALLAGLRARLPLPPDCEITLEANPGTFEAEKFRGLRAAGVNRLSIGVQSFERRQLALLGRIHDEGEARRAVEIGLRSFETVNLDLMYGLPGQTPEAARRDAAEAVSWGTPHLSFYQLTMEPGTPFHKRPPPGLPGPDELWDIEAAVHETLHAAGFMRYETSAWARPGRECRHNLNYWQFGDYLGIGAGAHSKLSSPDAVWREARARDPLAYMASSASGGAVREQRRLAREDLVFEFMMNALRLTAGFPVSLFQERTGLPILAAERGLALAEARGLLARDHLRIAPTELGARFLNELLQLFLE